MYIVIRKNITERVSTRIQKFSIFVRHLKLTLWLLIVFTQLK